MADGNHCLSPDLQPSSRKRAPARNGMRDFLETIVFYLVISVLLLKTFVAEAYVIPTGSMATTLWGNQKQVQCPQCEYTFPVNCSSEVSPQRGPSVPVTACVCPNCRFKIEWETETDVNGKIIKVIGPPSSSGDRILVSKSIYDLRLRSPACQDVVVFRFPDRPHGDPYIKRLIGKPGETIGIYYGDLYVARGLSYESGSRPTRAEDLRQPEYMYKDQFETELKQDAVAPLNDPLRKFHLIRKEPAQVLALRRLVYDNDHQAKDLIGKLPPRWPIPRDGSWTGDNAETPHTFRPTRSPGTDIAWLRYQHLLRPAPAAGPIAPGRELITDFLGYNNGMSGGHSAPQPNWVGDLILECMVTLEQAEGELCLELSRGVDRFQARFQLNGGTCTLYRSAGQEEQLGESKPARLSLGKPHLLRFANVDQRLMVWVDDALPFGSGVVYDPPRQRGPDKNDLEPASIGARGAALSVSRLKLWRDSYYTVGGSPADAGMPAYAGWSNPADWKKLGELPARTMYVQPGHYLCLGDNSPESSDSRDWGLVPERLLLGKALFILYPFSRAGPIR
jgi:signal peptidase I